ncbi:MAG: ABC transporter ATP-binding protein [Victivallales bacterium]|nr:ABC transporter ATP-binding protein [Victivallales bacterium]
MSCFYTVLSKARATRLMKESAKKCVVRFEGITKTYHLDSLDVPVLKGLDFEIRQGEFVGIMGESGSGKSTLLNLLGLLDVPSSGKYFLLDQEVEHYSDDRLAELRNRYIGFIFQSFNLFPHLSVEQNIEVPMVYREVPRGRRRFLSRDLAERVGLGHRLKHRPTELSGGECQRIAVARALGNDPSFLLADEPTGNLDENTSEEIISLFKKLHSANEVTIVMVTHSPSLKGIFDRIIYLRDGLIVHGNEPAQTL